MTKQRVANIFAYASLACTIWVGFSLYRARGSSHFPGLLLWLMIEVVGFLLAIVATALRSRLWWIALSAPVLMALFFIYAMGT